MHEPLDLALATCRELPEPDPDAEPLGRALAAAGIRAETLAWDDPDADFARARLTVLRSTWNYPRQLDAFVAWLRRTAAASTLLNPLPLVRWNLHKRYLLDLERSSVPIAPTTLVPRGTSTPLEAILAARGWNDVVIKPAVSVASYRTLRVGAGERETGERHLRALAADGDALVQRYLPSVETHGERAVVWVDGEVTHAVRKEPRFSGGVESVGGAVDVAPVERTLAQRAIAAARTLGGGEALYGRVDLAPGPTGEPVVMELELIEPSLFFDQGPVALARFVAALARRLER